MCRAAATALEIYHCNGINRINLYASIMRISTGTPHTLADMKFSSVANFSQSQLYWLAMVARLRFCCFQLLIGATLRFSGLSQVPSLQLAMSNEWESYDAGVSLSSFERQTNSTAPAQRRPLSVTLSANIYPIVASASIRYFFTRNLGIDLSLHSVLAISHYKANGLSSGVQILLLPQSRLSPFFSGLLGMVWGADEFKGKIAGVIVGTQFGLRYTSDHGAIIFVAFGPVGLFVSHEVPRVAILSAGFGWSF